MVYSGSLAYKFYSSLNFYQILNSPASFVVMMLVNPANLAGHQAVQKLLKYVIFTVFEEEKKLFFKRWLWLVYTCLRLFARFRVPSDLRLT